MNKSVWLCACLLFSARFLFSQTIPNPTIPPNPDVISPWGHTNAGTAWDTSPYLPFIYKNKWFRLMPPNGVSYERTDNSWTYDDPNKKYPLILFFHGAGETGSDNNKQLLHGGERHKKAVQSGEFPGFLLYPQNLFWTDAKILIEKILETYPVDPNRIYVHGLSRGGVWSWDFASNYPTLVAAMAPMSGVSTSSENPDLLYTPIRLAQGGQDTNPGPGWTQEIVDYFSEEGGHLEYFYYPNVGHTTWHNMYALPDFFTWFLKHKKNKIEVLHTYSELCPDDPVSVTMGFTPGFDDYEWRKDGNLMPDTIHKITATEYGVYTGRIKNRGEWSEWSEPVEVKIKDGTNSPVPQSAQLQSIVVPDINGNNAVALKLPDGYETYTYFKDGVIDPVGNSQITIVNGSGSYRGKVKEFGGCSSTVSEPFVVVNANGPLKPDPISNLQAVALSKTEIRLTWDNVLSPTVNETGFEVYRSINAGGPYALIALTGPNVLSYNDTNLPSQTLFYYKIRPVTNNGAAAGSSSVSATTEVDTTPPTAPGTVTVFATRPTSVGLSWTPATDDVGVTAYDVYVRQYNQTSYIKANTTTATMQTVTGLTPNTLYNFVVKAKDQQGNTSAPSPTTLAATVWSSLDFAYYIADGVAWSVLPDFNNLFPNLTGTIDAFSLSPSHQSDNFGFVFTGVIQIPTSGSYTFFTSSDDGSKLWVNNQEVVDNDGLHGTVEESGQITLSAGNYPIRVEFFERTGGEVLQVRWDGPGFSKEIIPSSRLKGSYTLPAAPSRPSNLQRTVNNYDRITINWSTYTGNGTEIEIYRSLNGSNWSIINTVPKTQNYYIDSTLQASTRYYYRLRAVNSGNVSSFTGSVNAYTLDLPPTPSAPANLQLNNITSSSSVISWSDMSSNEKHFEVYKSLGDNTSYNKIATLGENVTQYSDNSLFAHSTYYYKVLSKNAGGSSAYSNELQVTSLNSTPVLNGVSNISMRYGEVRSVPLQATDADNDFLIIGGVGLPAFAELYDDGTGNGILTISPTEDDMGVYPGLQLFARDLFEGIHTATFTLTVNNNHSPVISPVAPVTLKETNVKLINVSASDVENELISWTIENAPSFLTSTINGSSIELNLHPDLTQSGNYSFIVTATDSNGAADAEVISVTVEDYDPNFTMKVNFRTDSYYNGPADWNNMGPAIGSILLNKENGTASGITLTNVHAWDMWKDAAGVVPGVYPNNVNGSYIWFWNGFGAHVLRLTGLNPQGKYNLSFLSSNSQIDGASRMTTFTAAGQSQSVQANNNASQLANLIGLDPTAQGEIEISVTGPAGGYAVLNAMVIESYYEGNAPPPAPTDLEAGVVLSEINLAWTDNAFNEQALEIYESTDNITFAKIATLLKDITSFTDSVFVAGTTYHYKVRALNGRGPSEFSNTVSIVAPNRIPVILPVGNITIPELDMQWIGVSATDKDGDALNFTIENEPPFMWTEYVSDTKINLVFAPSRGQNGIYQLLLHCDDSHGARTTTAVNVTITDINDVEIRVNFTAPGTLAASPWNNITSILANATFSNLKASNNTTTALSLKLQDNWSGLNLNGNITGNNSGMYPDAVMANSFFVQDNTPRTILVSGLNPSRKYDFSFYASRMGVADARNCIYTIGNNSATLNASNNYSNLAKITGVKPTANGQVTISIAKDATSSYGYLNAMVIREFIPVPTPPAVPTDLISQVLTRSTIKLNWQDVSDDETAFEVWSSQDNNSSYTLLATLNPDVTTYTHEGLAPTTSYFYKVRAVNAVGPSSYSNETSGSTFDYSISVNYNPHVGGVTNWNNLEAFISDADEIKTVSNLVDDMGNVTEVSMTVVKAFAGTNPWGMDTGNDSGIVPDKVMNGSWWLDPGGSAILRFGNLTFLRKYNFSFFGSRAEAGNRNTVYTINGASVTLNAALNSTNLVQLKNITPDQDGTITVTISTAPGAEYGYLNGLIIQAIPLSEGGGEARIASEGIEKVSFEETVSQTAIKAYPNPFSNLVTLKLGNEVSGKLKINLVSASGVVLFEEFFVIEAQQRELDLAFPDQISQGVYMLRVMEDSGAMHNIRLHKK